MEMRVCSTCKKSLPKTREYFYESAANSYKPGYRKWYSRCIECERTAQKVYRRARKDRVNAQNRRSWASQDEGRRLNMVYSRYLYSVKYNYKLSEQEVRDMMDEQSGCCAICGNTLPLGLDKKNDVFCVDHDHKTGKVRGLLCRRCNTALGNVKDNISILESTIRYLQR